MKMLKIHEAAKTTYIVMDEIESVTVAGDFIAIYMKSGHIINRHDILPEEALGIDAAIRHHFDIDNILVRRKNELGID